MATMQDNHTRRVLTKLEMALLYLAMLLFGASLLILGYSYTVPQDYSFNPINLAFQIGRYLMAGGAIILGYLILITHRRERAREKAGKANSEGC